MGLTGGDEMVIAMRRRGENSLTLHFTTFSQSPQSRTMRINDDVFSRNSSVT